MSFKIIITVETADEAEILNQYLADGEECESAIDFPFNVEIKEETDE